MDLSNTEEAGRRKLQRLADLAVSAVRTTPEPPARASIPECNALEAIAQSIVGTRVAHTRGQELEAQYSCVWTSRDPHRSVALTSGDVSDAFPKPDALGLRTDPSPGIPVDGVGDEAGWFPTHHLLQVELGPLFITVNASPNPYNDAGQRPILDKAHALALYQAMEAHLETAAAEREKINAAEED